MSVGDGGKYDGGFQLSEMVAAQRGMSDREVEIFLATGQKPDLSQPPPEELETRPVMAEQDAHAWLSGATLTASSFFDFDSHHGTSQFYEVVCPKVETFKFDPKEARDAHGRWTDGPVGTVEKIVKKTVASTKKVTPAVIYKKHDHGATVGHTKDGKRMRWDAGQKKFVVETQSGDKWTTESTLAKGAAYAEFKKPDTWFEPTEDTTDTPKITPHVPSQAPESSVEKTPTHHVSSPSGNKIKPAAIYAKRNDGDIVAQSADGDKRMRWDAERKKFIVEKQSGDGWSEESALTKGAAYNDVKNSDNWFEPSDANVDVSTHNVDVTTHVSPNVESNALAEAISHIKEQGMSPKVKNDVINVLTTQEQLVGDAVQFIKSVKQGHSAAIIKDGQGHAFGVCDKGHIYLRKDIDSPEMTKTLASNIKPNAATHTKHSTMGDVERVLAHEMGHALMLPNQLSKADTAEFAAAVVKAFNLPDDGKTLDELFKSSANKNIIRKAFTSYASRNATEFIAEVWSAYSMDKGKYENIDQLGVLLQKYIRSRKLPKTFTTHNEHKSGQTGTKTGPSISSQTPERTPADTEPTTDLSHEHNSTAYTGPSIKIPSSLDQKTIDDVIAINKRQSLRNNYYKDEPYQSGDEKLLDLNEKIREEGGQALVDRLAQLGQIESSFSVWKNEHNLSDIPDDQLKQQLADETRAAFANKKIGIRVTPETLSGVLSDGRFKTQFETKTSKGANIPTLRAVAEAKWFGIGQDAPSDQLINVTPEKRPIYGYVMVDGIRPAEPQKDDMLSWYGDIQVVLKDHVRDRTTAMFGDSLNETLVGMPSPVNSPTWESFSPTSSEGIPAEHAPPLAGRHKNFSSPKFRKSTYAEAQIHDGVSTDDIDEVIFPTPPTPELQDALDKAGIKWRTLGAK